MAGPTQVPIKVFHLFGAIGGGAMGFKRGKARVGNLEADFQCLGSVDIDAAANRDFARLVGVPATTLDLMDREQYLAFHGHQPPPGWREATPQDLQRAAQNQRPNIVFLSAPCKGFSGLLSETKSKTDKYQALNRLTLRGVWLMLEAWADDPPELVLFENVPRLATRGRPLLDRITAMLRAYGYATAETTHDCGEIGGLAQSRKRFLLVARHLQKVPGLLYEPPRRPLRAVGEVLGRMPLPGAPEGGPMHRVPALQWKTWLRLAFVEAGSDWRSLNKLAVVNGHLRDYLVVPEMHHGAYGVRGWEEPSGTVAGASRCSNGAFSVADPRGPHDAAQYQQYGVLPWHQPSGTVTAQSAPGGGTHSVADPRCPGTLHNNAFRVVRYTEPARAVTGGQGAVGGCVADPRPSGPAFCKYGVTSWQAAAGTIISGSTTGQGAYAVADPRSGMAPQRGAYLTGGHYGVTEWGAPAGAVSSAACHDNGRWSVADPRATQAQAPELVPPGCGMPAGDDKLVAVIRAMDGTWHRPFTTLELAALQSLFDPEDPAEMAAFMLDGSSDSAWRERIGNAVPRAAAEVMAGVFGQCLLLAWSGETFQLSSAPVWVRPMVAALQVARGGAA